MERIGYRLILANTYHISNDFESSFLKQAQGLHSLMRWNRNLLTDSGGFQMVSLKSFTDVTETGVLFQHPKNSKQILLTPEESIHIQVKS